MLIWASHRLGEPTLPVRIRQIAVDEIDADDAVGQPQRRLHRLGEALLSRRLDCNPINDDVDVVLALLIQRWHLSKPMNVSIHPYSGEAIGRQLSEQLDVLTFASTNHRGEDLKLSTLVERHEAVDNLLRGLTADELAAHRAVGLTDAGPEQAQIIMNLCDGANGRARVAGRGLLIDGNCRTEALDKVDVGLIHLTQKLAGIGGKRLHISTLSLGEDSVESKGGLARSRQTGEHNHGVPGKVQIDIAQVVFPGASDDDVVTHRCHRRGRARQSRSSARLAERNTIAFSHHYKIGSILSFIWHVPSRGIRLDDMSAAQRPPGLCPSAPLHVIRAAKREATQRLLGATMGLSDDEWQAPSRLAGWTRAHIATHIARNAEAFEAVTKAVITNQKVPHLYPSDELRDRDIERGSERAGLQLQIDLDTTAGSLNTTFDALDDMEPGTAVWLTNDIRVDVTDLPALRLAEIALHHVDLDLGMTVDDLPDVSARTLLEWVCFRLRDRPEVPAMRIVSDSGLTDRIGGVGFATTVHGPDGALAGWLSGRGGTERLAGADQLAVPMLI